MNKMTLPVKGLRAKDLDRELLPHREVLEEYAKYGQQYDRSGADRNWERFCALVTGKESLRNQLIEQRVDSLYRLKDSKGKEWLTYFVSLSGKDWRGNKVEYFYDRGGRIEGMPVFHRELNPQTEEIEPGTTQILEIKTIYTIPFTKEKVNELSEFFGETVNFGVKGGGRRYTCNRDEFTNIEYDDLIALKTDYLHTDWYKQKQLVQAAQGGVK